MLLVTSSAVANAGDGVAVIEDDDDGGNAGGDAALVVLSEFWLELLQTDKSRRRLALL